MASVKGVDMIDDLITGISNQVKAGRCRGAVTQRWPCERRALPSYGHQANGAMTCGDLSALPHLPSEGWLASRLLCHRSGEP